MSKPRHIGDVEHTATMLDLVRQMYPNGSMSLSHVVIEEVAPGTGWAGSQRWADVLVLGMWPSKGLTLDGYEIKASKADLKKELADPTKHEALAQYCDHWWLLAWDESVLLDGIPESWGVMITTGSDGERELKVVKKAATREPKPWPRSFVCSLVRNAYEQSPGAAYVARACAESLRRGLSDGERSGKYEVENALRPLKECLYGMNSWKWPPEAHDTEAVVNAALERLNQGVLGAAPTEGTP